MTDFTLTAYRTLLKALVERGYEVTDFERAQPDRRHLILRHDIDVSIDAAVTMGEAEADLKCRSIYFVLLRTEMYNAFSRAGLEGLRSLLRLGHHVGLHFDCSLYSNDEAALNAAAEHECRVLEDILGKPVPVVSFHRPAQSLLNRAEPIAGRVHTYMPRFFSEMGYCSDSQGEWRHGAPLAHAAVAQGRALQLLTHPVWWTTPGHSPAEKLQHLVGERGARLTEEMAANSLPFQRHLDGLKSPRR